MTDLATLVRSTSTLAAATMTAADSIDPAQLPPGLPVYMGYGNGRWPDYQAIVQAHPGATVIDFTVYLANLGNAGDIEPGDMTPDQAPTFVRWRLAAGVWRPIVYSSVTEMPQVLTALTQAGIPRSSYRVLTAHYGRGEHICAPGACPEATANGVTADGTQWASYTGYDLSLLRSDFLGTVVTPQPTPVTSGVVGMAATRTGQGYWLAQNDGAVHALGDATGGQSAMAVLTKPVVGIEAGSSGYWLCAADGGVFSEGGAPFFGSAAADHLNQPVVGMAATPDGKGYWLCAADGGVFSFGDGTFEGSTGGVSLSKPVCGMAATPTGRGYWLVAQDGGLFTEGDATFHGNVVGVSLAAPVVGMAARPQGDGYWLAGADGGVFSFGAAEFHGSTGGLRLAAPVVGIEPTPSGDGYWLVAGDGGVFSFGDAPFVGSH